jgi:hypothetical protein
MGRFCNELKPTSRNLSRGSIGNESADLVRVICHEIGGTGISNIQNRNRMQSASASIATQSLNSLTWQFPQRIAGEVEVSEGEGQVRGTVGQQHLPHAAVLQRLKALERQVTRQGVK